MSVLKEKRTVSKAEFVNTANQIYVETIGFLTRLSARYSRLLAEGVATLAGEVMDHAEKANKIYPSDEQRKGQIGRAGTLTGGPGLPLRPGRAVDPLLPDYGPEPTGLFCRRQGKEPAAGGGHQKTGQHGGKPGEPDQPGGNPAAEHHGQRQKTVNGHMRVYF